MSGAKPWWKAMLAMHSPGATRWCFTSQFYRTIVALLNSSELPFDRRAGLLRIEHRVERGVADLR